MIDSKNEMHDQNEEELARKTARATLELLIHLEKPCGKTNEEKVCMLRQYIKIIEENISYPAIYRCLNTEELDKINATLKTAKIKLRYLGGKLEERSDL